MATEDHLHVSLPAALGEFVTDRVSTGGFADASQYVTSLIEADRLTQARDELERLIQEGIDSGPAIEVTDEFWETLRQRLVDRPNAGPAS